MRRESRRWWAACALAAICVPTGCLLELPGRRPAIDGAVYRRAEVDRAAGLEAEVERLRADLRQAEDALILAESGLRGTYTRADAVSQLAESRIEVARAAGRAPWRRVSIAEAREKLDEARVQIEQEHFGAALFFVHRARRIASLVQFEVDLVADRPGTLFIKQEQVNLRAGPSTTTEVIDVLTEGTPVFPERSREQWMLVREASGQVGWIHQSLLEDQ